MDIMLNRVYSATDTRGKLTLMGTQICETIEKAWRNNKRYVSCIPEGRYKIRKRDHPRYGTQLELSIVPKRETINILPATSLSELHGSIAPVTKTGLNREFIYSRIAFERLTNLLYSMLDARERVYLVITSI